LTPAVIACVALPHHGNSHVMTQEKTNKEIAAVIYGWLDKALPAPR
jgi:hypothetical protein